MLITKHLTYVGISVDFFDCFGRKMFPPRGDFIILGEREVRRKLEYLENTLHNRSCELVLHAETQGDKRVF